jgi:hypothetical protein
MSGTIEAFAEFAKDASVVCLFSDHQLGFTISAKVLLAAFHRPGTGGYGHRTQHGTGPAMFTRIRTDPEREIHMTVFPPADKSDGLGLPHFRTDPDTAAAKDAVRISERITHVFNPAAHRHVLDSPGVRGLGHQKFCQITPQLLDFIGIAADHHTFLHLKGAGGGHLGATISNKFYNTKAAGANIGKGGNMAEMRNTDSILNGYIQDAVSFCCLYMGSINDQGYFFSHNSPR